jgi:hypothetical protein
MNYTFSSRHIKRHTFLIYADAVPATGYYSPVPSLGSKLDHAEVVIYKTGVII